MWKTLAGTILTTVLAMGLLSHSWAQDEPELGNDLVGTGRPVIARLTGFKEVPSVSTPGYGVFKARLAEDRQSINYTLQWKNLEGNVTQAHVHFAQPGSEGGIMAWLCGSASNPSPRGSPVCPLPDEGKLEGTITAADIVGPEDQGIDPSESTAFEEALRAVRSGRTYVNVHTDKFPGGEIRGQIRARRLGPHARDHLRHFRRHRDRPGDDPRPDQP